MVSSVFGFGIWFIECSLCGYPHLDKDWFAVHPHRRHLCAGCGRHFRDTATGIGNPIAELQRATGLATREPVPAGRSLNISQSDYPGGIQIWGSNPSIIWSAPKAEEAGIHVHAFKGQSDRPEIDDTFSTVTIDGVTLDPAMVRTLMAQNGLPHLEGRVSSMRCMACNSPAFDEDEEAFTPEAGRRCSRCGGSLTGSGRVRKAISNPLVEVLERLSSRPLAHRNATLWDFCRRPCNPPLINSREFIGKLRLRSRPLGRWVPVGPPLPRSSPTARIRREAGPVWSG